jgi:hypothetical protein
VAIERREHHADALIRDTAASASIEWNIIGFPSAALLRDGVPDARALAGRGDDGEDFRHERLEEVGCIIA